MAIASYDVHDAKITKAKLSSQEFSNSEIPSKYIHLATMLSYRQKNSTDHKSQKNKK